MRDHVDAPADEWSNPGEGQPLTSTEPTLDLLREFGLDPASEHAIGALHFRLEDGDGTPRRWNTLRALRAPRWAEAATPTTPA